MTNTHKDYSEDDWENGELGQTEKFVKKTSAEQTTAVYTKLDLQMISIRLQAEVIAELKALASDEGLGYQPFIRQILTQYIRNKAKRDGTHG